MMVRPPSLTRIAPVVKRLAGAHMKMQAAAISSGSPIRRRGQHPAPRGQRIWVGAR